MGAICPITHIGSGSSSYTYDDLGRLTQTSDGHGATNGYGYDLADEQTSVTYPNNQTVTRGYDDSGRVHTISDWLGNTTTFGYDPDSNLLSTTHPASTGVSDQYGYDNADRMTSATTSRGSTTLGSIAYTRDNMGLVTGETTQGLPGSSSTAYGYDQQNRLTSAGTTTYSYDAAGNPTNGGTNVFDDANELTSSGGTSFGYDALGERTNTTPASGPATTYGWDQAGDLTSAQTGGGTGLNYSYSGDGLRAARQSGSSTDNYAWDRSAGTPQLLSDGGASYVYGPDGTPLEQIDGSGNVLAYHHDQLGSTRMLTDGGGQSAGAFSYDAYGNPAGTSGTTSTPLGYAGQYTDGATGMQYLRARWYDPATQQLMSRDPLEAQTHQPYSYADDDPVNETDPSGLCGITDPNSLNPFSDQNCAYQAANAISPAIPEAAGDGLGWVVSHPGTVADAGAGIACIVGGPFGCALATGTSFLFNTYENADKACSMGDFWGHEGITAAETAFAFAPAAPLVLRGLAHAGPALSRGAELGVNAYLGAPGLALAAEEGNIDKAAFGEGCGC